MSTPATFSSLDELYLFIKENPEYCIQEDCMSVYGCDRRSVHGFEACLKCKYILAGTWKESHRK